MIQNHNHYCTNCSLDIPFLENRCPACDCEQGWPTKAICFACIQTVDTKYNGYCPSCNTQLTDWNIVGYQIWQEGFQKEFLVSENIDHPESAGFNLGLGWPVGQRADYRLPLPDNSEIHVKVYEDHYKVHRDKRTANDPIGHLILDAPVQTAVVLVGAYFILKS
ncbi:hypothetical protein [Haladaptatus sp. ZSTT2]|uniref:hypothetical protein n=1 Tax=Haladaptatus sp. ZSTT2 TaxID=3120515 RepID=UPI00300EDD05